MKIVFKVVCISSVNGSHKRIVAAKDLVCIGKSVNRSLYPYNMYIVLSRQKKKTNGKNNGNQTVRMFEQKQAGGIE